MGTINLYRFAVRVCYGVIFNLLRSRQSREKSRDVVLNLASAVTAVIVSVPLLRTHCELSSRNTVSRPAEHRRTAGRSILTAEHDSGRPRAALVVSLNSPRTKFVLPNRNQLVDLVCLEHVAFGKCAKESRLWPEWDQTMPPFMLFFWLP